MGVVDAARVNSYLSSPYWTEAQWEEAERLCVEREDDLASRLVSPITPISYSETAAVTDTGLVATTYPVFAVTEFLGEPVDDAHPLPTGWGLVGHRVRMTGAATPPLPLFSFGALWPPYVGAASRIESRGMVAISYQAGWGPVPALVNAILRKVAGVMKNRHDDTIVTDDAGSATGRQTPTAPEEWTDNELTGLGVYRNPRGLVWR